MIKKYCKKKLLGMVVRHELDYFSKSCVQDRLFNILVLKKTKLKTAGVSLEHEHYYFLFTILWFFTNLTIKKISLIIDSNKKNLNLSISNDQKLHYI